MAEGQAQQRFRWIQHGAGALLSLALLAPALATADSCQPWPGEPNPLPRVGDEDEMLGRWAVLRVAELARAAGDLERSYPVRAHHLWERVLCIDPGNDVAIAGLARLPLIQVHRPTISRGPEIPLAGDGFANLDEPLSVPIVAVAPATDAKRSLARALAEGEDHLKKARFEEALASAASARAAVRALGASGNPADTVEVETLGATAAIALGREAEARSSFTRALNAKPDLVLDPMRTSPKVRRAFDAARAERNKR